MDSIHRLLECLLLLSITRHFVGGTPGVTYTFGRVGDDRIIGNGLGFGYGFGNSFPSYGTFISGSGLNNPSWIFGGSSGDFGLGGHVIPSYTGHLVGSSGDNGGLRYFTGINGRGYGLDGRNGYVYADGNGMRDLADGGLPGIRYVGRRRENSRGQSSGRRDGQESGRRNVLESGVRDGRIEGRGGQRSGSGGRVRGNRRRDLWLDDRSIQYGRVHGGDNFPSFTAVQNDPSVTGMFPNYVTSSGSSTIPFNQLTRQSFGFGPLPFQGTQQTYNPRMPRIPSPSRYIGSPDQHMFSGRAEPITFRGGMGRVPGPDRNRGGFGHQTFETQGQGENRGSFNEERPPMPLPGPDESDFVESNRGTGAVPPSPTTQPPTPAQEPILDHKLLIQPTNLSPPDSDVQVNIPDTPETTEKKHKHESGEQTGPASSNYNNDEHGHGN